jgi:hypothetical protein
MARRALLGAALLLLGPGCFFDPQLGSGQIACSPSGTCPSGQTCGGDERCHVPGPSVILQVSLDPAGAGRVVSVPPGLDCTASVCGASLPVNVPIRLGVTAASDYQLTGIDGCAPLADGSPGCLLTLTPEGATVGVHFRPLGGRTLWVRSFGGPGLDESYAIASTPLASEVAGQVRTGGGFDSAMVSLGPGFDVSNTAEDLDDALFAGFALGDGATVSARGLGGDGFDNIWHVATDPTGVLFVAGYIESTVDLGGGPRTIPAGYDAFVAAYDTDGSWLWDRVFPCGGGNEDEAEGVASDENGDVFVTGAFARSCDFGDGVVRDGGDGSPFVVKLDGATGLTRWARHFPVGTGGTAIGLRVGVGMSGDVAVAGAFRVSLADPADASTLGSAGLEDAFVMRLSGIDGTTVWKRRLGGAGGDWANSVAVDSDDNVYLVGRFQDQMTVGTTTLTAVGLSDAFVAKLSGAGTPAWSHGFGGAGDDDGYGVALDFDADDVLVAGGMSGTVDFGGGFVVTSEQRDGYLARFGADGSGPILVRRYGGAEDDTLYDVTVDPGPGHAVVVVGSFRGTADLGGPAFLRTSMGMSDTFVLALAP